MKTRKQLREILDDIEATIPEAKERHADEDAGFLTEIRDMVQFAVRSASTEDREWMINQVRRLLTAHGIPVTVWSTQ